jgi:DNA polymerase (family X)
VLDKFAIARAIREIALFLQLKRENTFRVRAYENGAAALEAINEDLGKVIDERRLTRFRGIGEGLEAVIGELYNTGRSEMLERLRAEMPPGILELSQVPGLTPKRVQALHDALKISSIAELQAACATGAVAEIKGFGKKTQENILKGIHTYQTREEKVLLLNARELANHLRRHFEGLRQVEQFEVAGSIRRWKEVVHNVNLVVATTDGERASSWLAEFPLVTNVETSEGNRTQVRLASGMRVDMLTCSRNAFVPALITQTGSPAHVERLRQLAEQQGYVFDEVSLRKGNRALKLATEEAFYETLGLPFIPPELREDDGEFEEVFSGGNFDGLITQEQIRGLIHCHTVFSDGKNTVEEMAVAAQDMDMDYITITDHSPAAHYAGGLTVDRLKQQWAQIEEAQSKVKVKLLKGTECDILEDGRLDYPDNVLDQFDVIIASIHSRMKMDRDQMTKRLVNCMKQRQFKIWGHALGRLVLRREPFDCNVEAVLDAAAESRVAIEVNGDPYRLDMEPRWIKEARARGIRFVISTDAHSTRGLHALRYGVHIARRGGLRKSEVLNTLSWQKFAAAVKPI